MSPSPFESVLDGRQADFALVHRPETTGPGVLEVFLGRASTAATLAELPLPEAEEAAGPGEDLLVVVPYRQLGERGFSCVDDGCPLICMTVDEQDTVPLAEAVRRLPQVPVTLADEGFDIDDDSYAEMVRRVVRDEIGRGEGANFVLKRSFTAEITGYGPQSALTFFRRLLERESGAYWTFLVRAGDRTFVGATPERHVGLRDGVAVMNPISGTYRYPSAGPNLPEMLEFLADRKETDELYMVVDEELKMMTRVCDSDVTVSGPYLKEMARLAHTGYEISGRSSRDPREILRETMFAPTVTGSPLENACRVIGTYESGGRGYYSGVVALIGRDERRRRTLDSAVVIRTAEIDRAGRLEIGVGATLVRHSDPASEVAETWAKAAGLRAALQGGPVASLASHPRVVAALAERNESIAGFWTGRGASGVPGGAAAGPARPEPRLSGRRVLIIDAEDTFTSMLHHQLSSLGLVVTVRRYDEAYRFDGYDLVLLGPGPGDPSDAAHPKIGHLRSAARTLLAEGRPFLAVCLSHQVLSLELGLPVTRRDVPNQGVQRDIDLFGVRERVGFYNSFAARSSEDRFEHATFGGVRVSREPGTGEVHALLGTRFASVQFHAESLLTHNGVHIIGELLGAVLRGADVPASHSAPGSPQLLIAAQ
ncbi:anthranilate synthase family protein [Streptomyces sp. BE282]|uniref:anthranilate synthase family protein n=1 Tax=Streptomyces sp. BE282 TaxID=3002527 RepID=UPI002E76EBDB|nr:anthranilate synthase family protein [Streptomyces sp. BE282]MEE1733722.1 anthranilate synthase family protein [Streptomyces sp. BE282]